MLFIIAVLGFSLIDVPRKAKRKINLEEEIKHSFTQIAKRKSKLEELEMLIEFKLQVARKELQNIKDEYRKKKFEDLISSLPFELGQHSEIDDNIPKVVEKVTLDDVELEIYGYIKTKYKLKKTIQKLQSMLRKSKDKNLSSNFVLSDFTTTFFNRLVFFSVVFLSGLVVLFIIMNGFNVQREFLQNWLKKLSFFEFMAVFDIYALFVSYLIIHGILKSKFQNFKGLNANGNTDVQSLIYFSRSTY